MNKDNIRYAPQWKKIEIEGGEYALYLFRIFNRILQPGTA